ncbi:MULTISPECIES: helix-turn-helix domain-containing protein [Arthrobacter]|uniref:Helix-turn-helix domain-containing protein n=2 Tax=Arthrobacter TaxID=1663 RepID=A0ABU9KHQ5_9MICC|nr:helix-turn-helix domain-containing protein [Arthrobacter sp. YJM1]MDP5226565.1 helix-turn-helix domain-containing protein [Arthrobacter sp. YJM1]
MADVVSKGHLNPGVPGVRMERFALARPGEPLAEVVRHLWFGRWSLPPGVVRPQRVLSYPAANLVIMPQGALLAGLGTAVAVQELSGESWVLGALLRPAATRLFTDEEPKALIGARRPLPEAPVSEVSELVHDAGAQDALAAIVRVWLAPVAERMDDRMRLCNDVCRLAEDDGSLTRVDELADRAGLPLRTLDRLVRDHVGVSPKWLLDCRRLQEAATILYADPDVRLADLALRLGFSDQAHFARSYRRVVGETPSQTRQAGNAARAVSSAPPRLR